MGAGSLWTRVGRRCLRELWQGLTACGAALYPMPCPEWIAWQLPPSVPDAIAPTGRPVWFERRGAAWAPYPDQHPMDGGTHP